MKKKVIGFIVAIAAITTGSVFAQKQADQAKGKQQTECCQQGKDSKKGKGERKGPKFNAFDGIQLNADQQQKLQVLREGLGPVKLTKEEKEKLKAENKGLTDEQKKQKKAERKAKKAEAKKNYLKGVKETLTPEQYVIFLENVYLYSPEQQKAMSHKDGKKKGGKDMKDSKKRDGKDMKDKKGKKDSKGQTAMKGKKKERKNSNKA